MKRTKRLMAVAVILLTAAVVASAQVGVMGSVKGTIIDRDGKPAVGAEVSFRNLDNQRTMALKTDKNGEYFGTGLMPGKYELRIAYKGQEILKQTVNVSGGIMGNPNETNFRNNFSVDMSKQQAPQGPDPAQSEEQKKAQDAYDRAVAANRAGKYEDALADLLPLAEKDPTLWSVQAQMGVAYQNLKRYEEAEASFKKAIELQPSNPALYSNLGQVYVKMGKQEDARRMFDAAAQLSPEDAAGAYFNIAVTFINSGDMKSAVDPLRKVTELDPSRADAHYWLGIALYSQSEYKTEGGEMRTIVPPGTREAFERYLQLQPNGERAVEAKAMLEEIDKTVPTSTRVKKK